MEYSIAFYGNSPKLGSDYDINLKKYYLIKLAIMISTDLSTLTHSYAGDYKCVGHKKDGEKAEGKFTVSRIRAENLIEAVQSDVPFKPGKSIYLKVTN